jgi:hypothetical protein
MGWDPKDPLYRAAFAVGLLVSAVIGAAAAAILNWAILTPDVAGGLPHGTGKSFLLYWVIATVAGDGISEGCAGVGRRPLDREGVGAVCRDRAASGTRSSPES